MKDLSNFALFLSKIVSKYKLIKELCSFKIFKSPSKIYSRVDCIQTSFFPKKILKDLLKMYHILLHFCSKMVFLTKM